MKTISIKPALLAAGLAAGTLFGMALPTAAQAQGYVSVQIGPPPPRYELTPPPRDGWVWVPGHYHWRHRRFIWIGGYWVRERPGYVFVAPAWEQEGGRWHYRPSRWHEHPGRGLPLRHGYRPERHHR